MSGRIVSSKGYVAGWLDTTMHDFLPLLSPAAANTRYALVTSLDSNPHPAALRTRSPELRSIRKSLRVVGKGLLVPTAVLVDADSRNQIFFGFDEVWFFPDKPGVPKPETATLLGPARVSQAQLDLLTGWMTDNGCSMGLAGGEGLNFVVRAHGVVRLLLGSSLEQPGAAPGTLETAAAS